MPRLLFEKVGKSIWMSHLDLMRLFQRAFKRAGLPLTHTQGFNPRPSVSIALPLSVGVESVCELLDFDLDCDSFSCEEMKERLNSSLVDGVKVLDVYDTKKKIRELAYLRCNVSLEYDRGVTDTCAEEIQRLFAREHVFVEKKTKNGIQSQDIIPMILSMNVLVTDENTVTLDAVVCCQNPTLNPALLATAISNELPQYAPDFFKSKRIELYDRNKAVFR